jgi:restriction system protein
MRCDMDINEYETFDEWFELVKCGMQVYPRFRIPYSEWLDEYIENISNKSQDEFKDILRYLLAPFTLVSDRHDYDLLTFYSHKMNNKQNHEKIQESLKNIEKYKRIKNGHESWEGLTWVIQYLPFKPYKAIKSLQYYLSAELMYLPDDRIIGIDQCIEIIEAKFINEINGQESIILKLKPRDFEWLIKILYNNIGYTTEITNATRDGGKDIIAYIKREDGNETVYVECKLYKTTELTKETVRAFGYTINHDNINRGTLFCTGYVNDELKKMDSRIQIWDLDEIMLLLNAHIGSNWSSKINMLIDNEKRMLQS